MKTYKIATERNGQIITLDTPAMAMRQAEAHADTLRGLCPNSTFYVININSI